MNLGLKGRVAIVTGASSGLGKAVALELATEGASVVLNARTADALEESAGEIRQATRSVILPIPGDVTREADVNRLIAETSSQLGRIDILVANAGGPPAGFFRDFSPQSFREAVELNLISTISLCRAAVPRMQEGRWGRIVAIASIAAKQPVENLILSNTARAGLLGFIKTLSQQVAADGVTANTVCPGYHLTERLKSLVMVMAEKEGITAEEVQARLTDSTPMKRLGDPRELSALVAFLCSDRAGYITGAAIQVDGGLYRGII